MQRHQRRDHQQSPFQAVIESTHIWLAEASHSDMAHFAEILDGVVQRVVVVHDNDEANGAQFCHDLFGGEWLQTSYNGNMRKQFAGVGFTYDEVRDEFVQPQPYPSWTLDENNDWNPPTPMPTTGGSYNWSEEDLEWVAI
jgi:hypothetical protein